MAEELTDIEKMKNALSKTHSKFAEAEKRMRAQNIKLYNSNLLKKHELGQYNEFVHKLLKERRVTKDELSEFFMSKEQAMIKLGLK